MLPEKHLHKFESSPDLMWIIGDENDLAILEDVIKGGITHLQIRHKDITTARDLVKKAITPAQKKGVKIMVNDHWQLVDSLGADGVHLGQDDANLAMVRSKLPHKIIGLSVGSVQEAKSSPYHLADYIGTGPVFKTQSKKDAGDAIGVQGLKEVIDFICPKPVFAIGGIYPKHVLSCITAGAKGIATISAIRDSKHPLQATRAFFDD